ncbi:Transcription initiation factor TFIID subunit 10 -like protein [Brachionus plicatilis]|uniref:Transcription initiation factor TFIID subunit 10-like protein n=1 Tax=Brachionus plicatilis TaxID=10195 RepID=A0A3M7RVX1_BRAPC|nr:Transcription initiation factor TFIID subunit 10 -like protein [Brachionus plicatilis]
MDDLLNNHDIDMLNSIDLNQQDLKLDDNEMLDSNGESMNQDENEDEDTSQKFISEIVNDVMQHHKLKSKTTVQGNAANASASNTNANQGSTNQAQGSGVNKNATGLVLTLEDLSNVLSEYGINLII